MTTERTDAPQQRSYGPSMRPKFSPAREAAVSRLVDAALHPVVPCHDCGATEDTHVPGGWRGIYICTDRTACKARVEAQRCKHPGCVGGIINPREVYHSVDGDGSVNPELIGGEMCPACRGYGKERAS